jgi:DNA-directed RNA polymerase subunit RPC12/RpoP
MKKPIISTGAAGEREVIKLIACPNCGKKLMALPPNYPLYDVQCTGCSFRAQIKTNLSKPKSFIFGAGWQIMHKVLKSGYMVPTLLLYFKWTEKGVNRREVRFYPFVPKKNLSNYRLSETARRANYEMFTYVGMDKLPYFTLYEK